MPTKPETQPVATPQTLSDLASQVDLGPIDPQTALIIKLCEAKAEQKTSSIISAHQTNFAALQEKYKAILRELRDKLQSIKVDDFVKVIIGLVGGLGISAFTQKGWNAIKDIWVDIEIFFFIIGLFFLIVRYLAPSQRKKELDKELQNLTNGSK